MDMAEALGAYLEFLEMNKLEISEESAGEYCDMQEGISPLMLSMEFARNAEAETDEAKKRKMSMEALRIYPDNFAAKATLMDLDHKSNEEYKAFFEEEYGRLLKEDYLNPIYYKEGRVDFRDYQETMNYLLSLRNHFIRLIFEGKMEEAIPVGEQIRELNPTDVFSNNPILAFLYLKFGDVPSAYSIVDNDKRMLVGTRELVYAYSSYLNLDTEGTLGYLDRMNACNPSLYRLFTGELAIIENYKAKDKYSDALYTYLNFTTVLLDNESDFYKIIADSRKLHPLLSSLMEDERTILEIGYLSDVPEWTLDRFTNVSRNILVVPEFYSYTSGRIEGILSSLTAREILFKDKITPYGRLYLKAIEKIDDAKAEEAHKEAMDYFGKNQEEDGLRALVIASLYAPHDFVLRGEYYLRCTNPASDGMEAFLREMDSEYAYDMKYYDFKDSLLRQNCKRLMHDVGYRYYQMQFSIHTKHKEAFILYYPRATRMYQNYVDLMDAVYNNFSYKKNTAIYRLYDAYKKTGQIEKEILLLVLKDSMLEYSYAMAGRTTLYSIMDEGFGDAYLHAIRSLSPKELLSDEELSFLEGVALNREGSVSLEILKKLDDCELIERDGDKNQMRLCGFLMSFFGKNDKKE